MNDLQAMQGAVEFAKVLQNCLTNPKSIEDAGAAIQAQLKLTDAEMDKRNEYNLLFHATNDAIKALAADKQAIEDGATLNDKSARDLQKAWDAYNVDKTQLTADQGELASANKKLGEDLSAMDDREAAVKSREDAVKTREDNVGDRETQVKTREDAVAKRVADLQAPITADK